MMNNLTDTCEYTTNLVTMNVYHVYTLRFLLLFSNYTLPIDHR